MNILLAICMVLVTKSFGSAEKTRPKLLVNGRPSEGLVPKSRLLTNLDEIGPSTDQYIVQQVNHFDQSNMQTFNQRYWYNNQTFVPGKTNTVFLMLEGDATASRDTLAGGLMMTSLASRYGALQLNLEHRYYGASNATKDLATPNLKFLSSRQALADVEHFIHEMNVKFSISDPRWIVFGGGYAGALAAWSDQLYPDLVYALIGSSAIMEAVGDNSAYLQVVEQVLNASGCGAPLHDGLVQIAEMLKTANGRQQLFKGFQLCEPISPNDAAQVGYFYSVILDPYMAMVTYGDNAKLCGVLGNSSGTPITNMYAVHRQFANYTSCTPINYNDYIQFLKNTDLGNADRAWFYQTCNEFGFYQSTDACASFFGNILPIEWYIQQCYDVFGSEFNNVTVYKNIDRTNSYYGGQSEYHGSYALLPSGTFDPWYKLGILNHSNNIWPDLAIGTWHCADMGELNATTDSEQLIALKLDIQNMMMCFLMGDNLDDCM